VRLFRPDVLHSFSRLAYLSPLLPTRLPKVMSYQRHTGGRKLRLAACLGGQSLHFAGCSEYICGLAAQSVDAGLPFPTSSIRTGTHLSGALHPTLRFVFLSRLETIKGRNLAIAIARASGRRLILAGNHADRGPESEFWRDRIAPHIGHDGIELGRRGETTSKRTSCSVGPPRSSYRFSGVSPSASCSPRRWRAARPSFPAAAARCLRSWKKGRTGLFVRSIADGVAAVARIPTLDVRHAVWRSNRAFHRHLRHSLSSALQRDQRWTGFLPADLARESRCDRGASSQRTLALSAPDTSGTPRARFGGRNRSKRFDRDCNKIGCGADVGGKRRFDPAHNGMPHGPAWESAQRPQPVRMESTKTGRCALFHDLRQARRGGRK